MLHLFLAKHHNLTEEENDEYRTGKILINKFCEEKRLTRRHGYVEYVTSMKYIHEYLPQGKKETIKILDVGAGTGRYSVQLAGEGYDVTAVELVKYNLGI